VRLTVFADLDDSLFMTHAKASARAGGGELVLAATDKAGDPLSYHSPDQVALLELLGGCALVPVTGRNREALARVVSPHFDDYRIASHGALIYAPHGGPLGAWHADLLVEAARFERALQALAERTRDRFGRDTPGLRARVIEDAGIPVYVSVKVESEAILPDPRELLALASDLGKGWRIHKNGRNVAYLPPYADKARAVAHVMEIKRREDPNALFLGLGDSLSDIPFLKLCHFAMIPRDSQIHAERL
jgi:hydroxymethylpyrimidine pyrophosphatase-like HAD family hydrolase